MSTENGASNSGNGHNGYTKSNGVNGSSGATAVNGTISTKNNGTKAQSYGQTRNSKSGGIISNYLAARKQSSRPLPTEMGDGTYRQIVKRPTTGQDLRTLKAKGKLY